MIGYLSGRILEQSEGLITVAVGAAEGSLVGYQVYVSDADVPGAYLTGQQVSFFVYTNVREDALDLYGFKSKTDKDLFLTLISVNGIGPKLALSILAKVESSTLLEAILNKDKQFLVRIPGIGKKTAERVVLELSDKIAEKVKSGAFKVSFQKSSPKEQVSRENSVLRDAKDALVGLGYRESEVFPVLNQVLSESETNVRVEEVIRTALKQLG